MRTVLLGEHPPGFDAWLERRRALGQDGFDEVWEGEYHVAPMAHSRHGHIENQLARLLGPSADAAALRGSGPLNVGEPDDYRVPDLAYLRDAALMVFHPTVAIGAEIVSPGDETRRKLAFYFRRGVEELLIVDPETRTVEWHARGDDGFVEVDRSALLDITADELTAALDWGP